jgi:hypothetical protein
MSAVGSSADNALAESFNATFKREPRKAAARSPTNAKARPTSFRLLHR